MNNQFRHGGKQQEYKSTWDKAKRIMAVIIALLLWLASMQFSLAGFSFNMDSMTWLGWVLAAAVTVIELMFNTDIQKLNLTLFVVGLLAYAYGVITNIIGFYAAQGGSVDKFYTHPESILFAALVGFILEIVPEPMFIWGIGVEESGDFLANIFRGKKQIDNNKWTGINPEPNINLRSPKSVQQGLNFRNNTDIHQEYQRIVNNRNKAPKKPQMFRNEE